MKPLKRKYSPDFASVYDSTAGHAEWISRQLSGNSAEGICAVLIADRQLERHQVWGESAAEFVRHVLNSQSLPEEFPECHGSGVGLCEQRFARASTRRSKEICLQARREMPGALAVQFASASTARLVQTVLIARAEVWRETRGLKIALSRKLALWRERVATMLKEVDWLGTFGTAFSAGALVELLHMFFERAIACVRRILRALRAGAHALFDVVQAVVSWDPHACAVEQLGNVLKKLAAAGLIVGGSLFEPVVEAAIISHAPWAAAVADVLSAVLTGSGIVLALYLVGKLVDHGLGIEQARKRHYTRHALKTLGGGELLELLARIEVPEAPASN